MVCRLPLFFLIWVGLVYFLNYIWYSNMVRCWDFITRWADKGTTEALYSSYLSCPTLEKKSTKEYNFINLRWTPTKGWQWVGLGSNYLSFDFAPDKIEIIFFNLTPLRVRLCILQLCSDSDTWTSNGAQIITNFIIIEMVLMI